MRSGTLAVAPALALTFAVGALAPAGASTTSPDVAPTNNQLTVTGNGFGHGRGLSQYGAYGRAKAGQSASQILSFYYPGTTLTRASGALRVLVTDAARFVTVKPARSLRVHAVGGRTYRIGHRGVTAWRLRPYSARTSVQYKSHGRWHRYRTLPGTMNEFVSGAGKLVLVTPTGQHTYRGRIRSVKTAPNRARAVNVVTLEGYLRGVVAAEMPSTWSEQALRAQAIAARTYAWYSKARSSGRIYDICDTTACQVYGGVASERPTTNEAVAATAGDVLSAGGSLAFTEFSASNGGWTAASTLDPTPQADPYDTAYQGWKATIDTTKLANAAGVAPTNVAITRTDNAGSAEEWGGRAQVVTMTYPDGSTRTLTGDQFRSLYGLRSTWFTLS